jgi:regulator of cell morphogenesis and NO signaling
MEAEHEEEGQRQEKIRQLTNDYTPPADACGSLKLTYALLKQFKDDLHEHIHLENNLIFPRALEIESRVVER